MIKVKKFIFSIIAATAAFSAFAQPSVVYTPNYKSHFAPIYSPESFDSKKFQNQFSKINCNPSTCETAQIILSNIQSSMRQANKQGRKFYANFEVPINLYGYVNIPGIFNNPHVYKGHGEAEFYYQALTFSPFIRGYEMPYEDVLKVKASIDSKLQEYEERILKEVKNKNAQNANIPNTLNEKEFLAIFEASKNNLHRRQKVVAFMLSSPEAFNNYKNAFNKFYTVTLPLPEKNFQPKLKPGVLKNAKLTAYECQFINAVDDFITLQAQNHFTCPNQ